MSSLTKAVASGLAGLALLVSNVLGGCSMPENFYLHSGYQITTSADHKTLTVTEGVVRFSLDYPSRYYIAPTSGFSMSEDSTYVGFEGPLQESQRRVYISMLARKSNGLTFISDLQDALAFWRQFPGFVLLERSPIEVAGLRGEQILYSYTAGTTRTGERQGIKPWPVIVRHMFFSDNSLRWWVSLAYFVTTPELAEGYEADLRQVLTTLRIADQ